MKRRALAVAGSAVALAAWVGVSAQQEMLPRPGPGSGVTPVRVVEEPIVRLAKESQVRVLEPLSISIRPPSFVTGGDQIEITWATGEVERVTVGGVLEGGWIAVGSDGGRYVNLGSARSIRTFR